MGGDQQSGITSLLGGSDVNSPLRIPGPQRGSSLKHEIWNQTTQMKITYLSLTSSLRKVNIGRLLKPSMYLSLLN